MEMLAVVPRADGHTGETPALNPLAIAPPSRASAFRTARLAELKKAIDEGRYQPTSIDIAHAMAEESDLLRPPGLRPTRT
jgi:hypothetical protein